jgi:dihydroorotase
MITIKNVKTLDNQIKDYTIPSLHDHTIEAGGKLLLLPGLVDPHISFGSINGENRNWDLAISSAIRGGLTTVIEIPNQHIPCNNQENLEKKRQLIDKRLSHLQIPLHYFLYANADLEEVEGIGLSKKLMKGIVIQLDPNKKEELNDQWDRVFQMAAWENLPIIVNSCNENTREEFKIWGHHETLLEKAIYYAERQNTRLYILNVATQKEIDLIQEARRRSLLIYAETTPQHLFQQDISKSDCLWKALSEGVIETLGSGYNADHPGKERALFRGGNFSFLDPIFFLPLLLTARQEGKISIEQIVRLTKFNIHNICEIPETHDVVLVDLEKEEIVQKIEEKHTINMTLIGWPIYTIVQGNVFSSPKIGYHLIHPD